MLKQLQILKDQVQPMPGRNLDKLFDELIAEAAAIERKQKGFEPVLKFTKTISTMEEGRAPSAGYMIELIRTAGAAIETYNKSNL